MLKIMINIKHYNLIGETNTMTMKKEYWMIVILLIYFAGAFFVWIDFKGCAVVTYALMYLATGSYKDSLLPNIK